MANPSIQLGWLAAVLVVCLAGGVLGADLKTDLLVKPLNCPLTCPNGTDNGIFCVQIGGTSEGSTLPMTPRWACDLMPAILGVADRPVTEPDAAITIQCPAAGHLISYGEMYKTTVYACYNDNRSSNSSLPAALSSTDTVASPAPSTNSTTTTVPAITKESASSETTSSPAAGSSDGLLADANEIEAMPANVSSPAPVIAPTNVSSRSQLPVSSPIIVSSQSRRPGGQAATSSAGCASFALREAVTLALFAGLLAATAF